MGRARGSDCLRATDGMVRLLQPRHGSRRCLERGGRAWVSGRGLAARSPAVLRASDRRGDSSAETCWHLRRSAAEALRGRGSASAASNYVAAHTSKRPLEALKVADGLAVSPQLRSAQTGRPCVAAPANQAQRGHVRSAARAEQPPVVSGERRMCQESSVGQAAGVVASDIGFADDLPESACQAPLQPSIAGPRLAPLDRKEPMHLRLCRLHRNL
jgi:hypothetical protein